METLIRCRVLRHLIWVCTVCHLPFYQSPDYNGLINKKRNLWYLKYTLLFWRSVQVTGIITDFSDREKFCQNFRFSGRSFGQNFGFSYMFFTFSPPSAQHMEKSASLERLLQNHPLGWSMRSGTGYIKINKIEVCTLFIMDIHKNMLSLYIIYYGYSQKHATPIKWRIQFCS